MQAGKIKGVVSKAVNGVKQFFGKILAKLKPKKKEKEGEIETIPELYLPETTEDLVWLLKKLPEEVLTKKERQMIASSMSFEARTVRDVMTPKDQVTFVHENDFMGPLMLDRLYKSGFSHFPVIDTKGVVTGVLHTDALNSLEVRETDRASSFVDKSVYYMRDNYTLGQALAAFSRTNSHFFVVVNQGAQVVGLITFESLVERMLGELPKDDFNQDTELMAVAKRGLGMSTFIQRTDVAINAPGFAASENAGSAKEGASVTESVGSASEEVAASEA